MNKTHRILLALFAAVFLASAVAAEEIPIRISWWGGTARQEGTLKAIQLFESRNPGVSFKSEYMGWTGYLERLTVQMGANTEPDIMLVDWAWLNMFSSDGNGFYDIYQLKDSFNLGEYADNLLDMGTVKGKLNAIPLGVGAQIVIWNKTMWDKAGLTPPTTWADLLASGEKVVEKLGPEYRSMDTNSDLRIYMTHAYIFQKTGKQFLDPEKPEVALTRDELVEWTRFHQQLMSSKTYPDLPYRSSVAGGDTRKQNQELEEFISGKWMGANCWDASIRLYLSNFGKDNAFTFTLGEFPTMPDMKSSGRVARPNMMFAISKNSKHPEIAAKFLDFILCTEEGVEIMEDIYGVLPSNIAFKTQIDNKLISELNRQASEQIRNADTHLPSPYFEHPRMLEMMRTVFEELQFDKITPEEAADTLLREGNRLVARLAR